MNYFEWKIESPEKDDLHQEKPCLLWLYDNDVKIGYSDDGLWYWLGGRWVNSDKKPIRNHPDIDVVCWCYVPYAKCSRYPVSGLTKRVPDARKSAPKSRSKTSKGSVKPARG